MRLWHEKLIPLLPREQLLGQHRECCALRGKGWNKKHSTINYVFNYLPYKLFQYHLLVMEEMKKRNYVPNNLWYDPNYRGKNINSYKNLIFIEKTTPIYPEHNDNYLSECIENLKNKNINIQI